MMEFRKLIACGFVAALAVLPLGGSDMAMASGSVTYYTFPNGCCSGQSQTTTTNWSTVEFEMNSGAANSYKRSDQSNACYQSL